MSETEHIESNLNATTRATLDLRILDLKEELNNANSELNQLVDRLVTKTVEHYESNEYCMEGTVDFLTEVIGDLRTKEWILSRFSRDFQLSVNFTVVGSNAEAAYDITHTDLLDFIKTYFESYGSKVELDRYDIREC